MELGKRKILILKAIIDDYIVTGQPVGSKTVSETSSLGVSPATIRNEMAILEELGYLLQPHKSAGRIPSDIAYRMYVDLINRENYLFEKEQEALKVLLHHNSREQNEIISLALKILSDLTGYTSVVSLPLFKKSKLANMKLIKVNSSKVLLIIISDTGIVKNVSLPICDIEQETLDKIASLILKRFKDKAIHTISVMEIFKLKDELGENEAVIDYLLPILRDYLRDIEEFEIFVEGENKIFKILEFENIIKAEEFMNLISDNELMYQILKEAGKKVVVKIGVENERDELKKLSLIASPYKFQGVEDGRIGVIGPTRMNYHRVISSVEYASRVLSSMFSEINL